MIDGYSVQEAASVLGVPEGRVWELLARGVLSGTPEGDSMRVFLKSQAGPIVRAGTPSLDDPPRSNGNRGSHNGGEASAFRELLTEFRNLTERYGQALLALGESRGEVAGLRSRVDLLEARLDLRLPPARDEEPVAWESTPAAPTEPAAPAPMPVKAPPPRRAAAAPAPQRASRPRRARSSREAVAGFAEALARAEDPTAAEMPSPQDAQAPAEAPVTDDAPPIAEAIPEVAPEAILEAASEAAPVVEMPESAEPLAAGEMLAEASDSADVEAIAEIAPEVDMEAPVGAAQEIAVEPSVEAAREIDAESAAEKPIEPNAAPAPSYSADVVEPDWFADGDFAWLDVAEIEARGAAPVEERPVAPETEAAVATAELEETEAPVAAAEREETEAPVAITEPEVETQPEAEVAAEVESPFVPEPAPAAEGQIAEAWEPDPRADVPIEPEFEAAPLSSFEIAAEQPASDISVRDLEPELMPSVGPAAEPEPTPEPAPEGGTLQAVTMVEPSGDPDPEPWGGTVEALAVPAGHATGEEELMWLGGREAGPTTAASEMEVAAPGWRHEPAATSRRPEALATDTWPASDVETVDEPRSLAMTEDELTRLARAEGWDAAEVAAIRAMIASSPPPSPSSGSTPLPNIELPGADELDEAIAALESATVAPAADPSRSWAKAPPQHDEPVSREEWAYEAEPPPPAFNRQPPTFGQGPMIRRPLQDPGWLRTRRGPAATAYRRLRRLFPG